MKKLLSIILSLVMLTSVGLATIPAFAAPTVGSLEEKVTHNRIITQVNGKDSKDIHYDWISDNPKTIKFTYTGDGTVTGWNFGDLKEGTDYKIIGSTDDTITIQLLKDYDGDITANASVKFSSSKTTSATVTKGSGKSNKSSTSPKTGAAAAAGIAAMGAGIAVLAAAKKKED